ncbi:MAG: aminotransferase class V-fold PLP-dependent enzyme [Gemmatimonadales bacterium]|nr:MAG: aminotransferase class V-fold PLP-dependent enzyme [Gemmatimonadales bacterium]
MSVNAPDPASLALTPDEMRALGYQAVDALVERWTGLEDAPPLSGASRAELDERLAHLAPPPEEGRDPARVLEEAVGQILPLAARVDHPRFWAYVPSAPTWPSVVADFLVAGHNVFQGTWQGSAGPSWVELQVVEWFRQWIRMPEGSGGVFTSGGSMANFLAVVTALHAAGRPARPAVYMSDQAHSSLARAARAAGIAPECIRILPTGPDLLLDPQAVDAALTADRQAGLHPVLVCANGGATNTGRVDPLRSLVQLARHHGVRCHVDAAFGGFAALVPEGRQALDGLGGADSITLDPHKWLFQPFECGCLMVRDIPALEAAFAAEADYLQDTELGREQVNFGARGLQLTRQARALKVWMSVRTFGTEAIRDAVGRGMEMAHRAESMIRARPDLQLLSPATLGIVAWRCRPPQVPAGQLDALNRAVQAAVVDGGHAMISSTRLGGEYALRFCFVNPRVRATDVEAVLDRAVELARAEGP